MAVSNNSLENSSVFNNQFSQVNIKESSIPVLEAWLGQTSGGRASVPKNFHSGHAGKSRTRSYNPQSLCEFPVG